MDKNYILREIQRTAAANGGVPLGRHRFSAQTGIKYTDWSGKYWARWSDALREAGLAPNKFRSPFDEEFLLQKFALLAREYHRFPVMLEMDMKRRQDRSFPNSKAFRRLGSKHEIAAKLLAFCLNRTGYEDVAEICRAVIAGAPAAAERIEQQGKPRFGEVYLLKSGRYYKVGRTNVASRRGRALAIQLPERSALLHVIKTDDPDGIESYWHRRFGEKRKNGEWFNLNAADVDAFRRRKFM
jgi:hypothetical protein